MNKPAQQKIDEARGLARASGMFIVEKTIAGNPAFVVYRRIAGNAIRLGRRNDPARLLAYVKRLVLTPKPMKPHPITGTPAQLIKVVWGLGRNAPNVDLTLVCTDPTLMCMDAPEIIPTGSTKREELEFDGVIWYSARTDYISRSIHPCR